MCCRSENLFMSSIVLPFRLPGFVVDHVSSTETALMIDAHANSSVATCPYCQQTSGRIHSYYRLPAARQLAWLLLRPLTALSDTQQVLLQHLRQEQEVATAYDLTQQFLKMVRERTPDGFDAWLAACATSGVNDLVTFAAGLQRGYKSVRSALELPYSTG